MFYVKLSESTAARRRVPILMVDETDGTTPLTGLTLSGLVSKNGGTFAGIAGSFAEAGYGQYYYQFSTGEIDTLGWTGLHVTATGARNYDAIIHVTAYDAYSGSFIAPTDVWNADISAITSAGTAGSQLNLVASGGAGITAGDVWDYATRTLTAGAGITAGDVWEYDISAITGAGTAGSQVNIAAAGGGVTAGDVWSYDYLASIVPNSAAERLDEARFYASQAASNTGSIAENVWSYNPEYGGPVPAAGGYLIQAGNAATTIASDVWNYDISAVSGAGLAGTQLNLAAAPGAGGGITAGDVWSYATREITGGTASTVTNAVLIDPVSMSGIANTVWNTDVSAFTSPSAGYDLTQAASGGAGITAGDVWDYVGGRTITGGIADTVTTVTNGVTVTTNNDKTGYSLSSTQTFDLTGNITGNLSGSVGSVTSDVPVDEAAISADVWSYATRTLTSGSGITAGDVWTYDISAISTAGTAGSQLNLAASPSGVGISAYDVWNFDPTAMTSPQAGAILTDIQTDTNSIITDIGNVPNNVWASDVSGYSTPGEAGYELYQAGSAIGITSGDVSNAVWDVDPANYSNNGTFGKGILRSDIAGVAGTVTLWSGAAYNGIYADAYRIDASYDAATALKNVLTGVGSTITGNITGDLSGSVGSVTTDVDVSTASMSGIANTVWSTDVSTYATAGTAGSQLNLAALPSGAGVTAGDVWSYATREITGGTVDTITNPVDISTQSVTDIWSEDVSAYSTPSAGFDLTQAASGSGLTAGDVWDYATRTITGGAIDTNNDKSGYSLSASQAFDLTGNITGNLSGSVGSVTNAVDITTNSMSGTAGSVWDYATRTLTSGSGLTAGDVWSYATRDITGGTVDNVTNDVNVSTASMSGIANTVWSVDISGYTSPSAGYDLSNANAGAGITAGAVADAVWNAQVATYATAGSNETLGTDTYGTKIARTVNINRPLSINTANAVVVGSIQNSAINATSIASNAFTEAKFATDALTSRVIAPDAITSAELAPSANTEIADAVWAYATRNITGGTITTVSDKTGYSLSGSQTFDVTGNITGDLSGSVGSVTTVSNGAISAASFLAGAIDAAAVASDAVTEIANGVWSVGTRTITGGTITTVSDKTGYSLSGTQSFNLTGNITGNLSGSVGSVSGAVGSVTADVNVSTSSMSGIAGTVWSTDISSYTSPSAGYSLAVAGSGGVSAADVWSYNGGRTITGGTATTVTNPILVDTTSMSGIAGTVWTYATREITGGVIDTNNDKTDYALSTAGVNAVQSGLSTVTTAQVGQEVDASLLDVGLTSTVTGRIDATVSSRLASSSYTAPPTTAAIATTVWSAATRTLTSGAGATAGDVWSYNISGITASGLAGAQLNDASVNGSVVTVVNGPYKLTSTAEGVDGRIDILADSVQTIQLSCLDGFGSPFNIGGYTSVVNVYDVSGALAATYTPTVDFAQNGILSFEIDADITGVTGRYTLVVELTAGAEVIQLGPLEVLVRPL